MIGLTPAAVSANLHPEMTLSEGFLVALGTRVADFNDVIVEYFSLKGNATLSAGMESYAAGSKQTVAVLREREVKIERVRKAEKELMATLHELVEDAIKRLDSG